MLKDERKVSVSMNISVFTVFKKKFNDKLIFKKRELYTIESNQGRVRWGWGVDHNNNSYLFNLNLIDS